MTSDPSLAAKRAAGRAAAELVRPGMRLGLGTGSTFLHVLERLAQRVQAEGLDVVGVPTSEATTRRARELGLRLTTLDDVPELDLAIDGADEVDAERNLIKGGGGALLREKIVAAAARELVIVVDAQKVVRRLGAFPLPVEIVPFGAARTQRALAALGCTPRLRLRGDGEPMHTDSGHWIADCAFGEITDAAALEQAVDRIPGVVESGLFVAMTGRVFVGHADGAVTQF